MATIGLDKLYYAKITEAENGEETYEKPVQLAKAMSADLSVELAEATLYADDGAAEIVKEFKSGVIPDVIRYKLSNYKTAKCCRAEHFHILSENESKNHYNGCYCHEDKSLEVTEAIKSSSEKRVANSEHTVEGEGRKEQNVEQSVDNCCQNTD